MAIETPQKIVGTAVSNLKQTRLKKKILNSVDFYFSKTLTLPLIFVLRPPLLTCDVTSYDVDRRVPTGRAGDVFRVLRRGVEFCFRETPGRDGCAPVLYATATHSRHVPTTSLAPGCRMDDGIFAHPTRPARVHLYDINDIITAFGRLPRCPSFGLPPNANEIEGNLKTKVVLSIQTRRV